MVDIQTVSIAITSASVVAGVVHYAPQLRHQARARQDMVKARYADLLMASYSTCGSKEFQEAMWEVIQANLARAGFGTSSSFSTVDSSMDIVNSVVVVRRDSG